MNEIGSEFWERYPRYSDQEFDNVRHFLSGRIALEFIIKDIMCEREVKSAFLPSYCCDSMIEPFERNNILVRFYPVDTQGISYDFANSCDLVLLLDYFGYGEEENEQIANLEAKAGKIVIYDSTHKLNGNASVEKWAQYSFCSYRKWFYSNDARVVKHNGSFSLKKDTSKDVWYTGLRDEAALLKHRYINGEPIDKCQFLQKFAMAEDYLEELGTLCMGEPVCAPILEIIEKRRGNAAYLMERLSCCKELTLWKSKLLGSSAPLFVPILLSPNQRDGLRNHFIANNIFCPVHWPKTERQTLHSDFYDKEISLICDQRYDICHMERIATEIEKFFSI